MRREPARSLAKNQCFAGEMVIAAEHTRTQCSNDTSDIKCFHGQASKKMQRKLLQGMSCWCPVVFSLWPLNERLAAVFQATRNKGGILMQHQLKRGALTVRIAILMLDYYQQTIDKCDEYHKVRGNFEMDDSLPVGSILGLQGLGTKDKRTLVVATKQYGEHSGFMVAQPSNRLDVKQLEQFRLCLVAKKENQTANLAVSYRMIQRHVVLELLFNREHCLYLARLMQVYRHVIFMQSISRLPF